MIKRIATAVLIVIASLIVGVAISPNAGVILWLVCIVAAITVFSRSGKRDPKPKI